VSDPSWLTDEVVAAVLAHMNGDHADDCAVICRGLGGRPQTVSARMTGLDLDAFEFVATDADGDHPVRVACSRRLADRAQIRAEAARMCHESAAALGLPPRGDEG
jgi:hypothetical protein